MRREKFNLFSFSFPLSVSKICHNKKRAAGKSARGGTPSGLKERKDPLQTRGGLPERFAMPTHLLILDTSSLFFRAFHALPSLTSASGEPAGAVYGFLSLLFKAVEQLKPTHIAAALDLPGPTVRDKILPTYKANRPEIDPELSSQLAHMPEALRALGILGFASEGYEADDVIGTIAAKVRASHSAANITILSGDLDTLQLVDDKISAIVPKKGISETVRYTPAKVVERFGIGPDLVTAFKAIKGDPSDNISGIAGIGEKGAAAILQKTGSLKKAQQLLCKDQPPKELVRYQKAFCAAQKNLPVLLQLVTIKKDVPLEFSLEGCRFSGFDRPEVGQFLSRFGFASLSARVRNASASVHKQAQGDASLGTFIIEQEKSTHADIDRAENAGLFSHEIAELERTLIPVISDMERRGIFFDRKTLGQLGETLRNKTHALQEDIFVKIGQRINLASPVQLRAVLFEKLGLRSYQRTGKGKTSTAAAALEKLHGAHPVVDALLRWRELNKLITTYVDALPKLVDMRDGKIHAKFWQLGTVTGRIASTDPNLQNIPIRTKEGRAIRASFRAQDGSMFVSCDYSQMELRIAAVLSEDERLLEIFKQDGDVHRATAARVFGVSEKNVTDEMRSRAKTVNFAMLYGAGFRRVAQELRFSQDEAQALLDEYFAAFPRLTSWIEKTREGARRDGFIETAFGRRRYLPDISSSDQRLRAQAERMATNTPIQGCAADLVKRAMVACARQAPRALLLVQVHDELLFEIPSDVIKDTIVTLRIILEGIWSDAPVSFPIKISRGSRWGEWEQ